MKRKTKAQRDADRLAQLTRRIEDIYAGAIGESDRCVDNWCVDLAAMGRVLMALRARFGFAAQHWMLQPHNFEIYASPGELAARMCDQGFDADGMLSEDERP